MSTTSELPNDTQAQKVGADAIVGTRAGDTGTAATSTEQAVRDIVDDSVEAPAKTSGATADIIRELTRRTAEQAEESLRLSIQAAASAQVPLVDAGNAHGRSLLETTLRVATIHHEAAQRAADDVKDLTGSLYALARGTQRCQQACLELAGQSMTDMTSAQRDLSWASSPVAFAEMQRDFYSGMVRRWFHGYAEWLRIASNVAQDGLRPLQERPAAR